MVALPLLPPLAVPEKAQILRWFSTEGQYSVDSVTGRAGFSLLEGPDTYITELDHLIEGNIDGPRLTEYIGFHLNTRLHGTGVSTPTS